MRTTTRLCLVVSIVAAVGLLAIPATAAAKHKGGAAHHRDANQNQAIQKAQNKADKAHERIEALKDWNQSLSDWNTSQDSSIQSVAGTVATIVAGVPTITNALTQLQGGLVALQGALQNTVSPALTALSAGLTSAGSAIQSVEYGAIGLFAGGGTKPVATLVSSDIPDDGNPASVSGQVPMTVGGGTTLNLRAAIRSNESDGAATGPPVGQVGGLLYAVCATSAGGGCAGGAVPAGNIACTPAQTPAQSFTLPTGPQDLTLVNIQEKAARTDQSKPDGSSTDALNGGCSLPGAGTYIVYVNAQFVDLPTSTSPGPTE